MLARIEYGRSLVLLTALMLALGLGLLPEQCEGLKCDRGEWVSSAKTKFSDVKRESVTIKKDCSEDQFCYNHTKDFSRTSTFYDWGCIGKEINKCFQDIKGYGGRGCHVVNRLRESNADEEIGKCIDLLVETRPEARIQNQKTKVLRQIVCLCQADLCNWGSGWVAPGEKIDTTTVRNVVTETEGGIIETTTGQPDEQRTTIGGATRWVMYVGIALVVLFVLPGCYLLCLYLYKKCGRGK